MVYGDRYGYDRVVYVHNETPVEIVCPEHGSFFANPHRFLQGHGCQKCGLASRIQKRTTTLKEFTTLFRSRYRNKYRFDETTFLNFQKKIKVTCSLHGEFWKTPRSLLLGYACPQCGGRKPVNRERFLREAKEKHGNAYDYSKVGEITGYSSKVTIICPRHGEFTQRAYSHILGRTCPKCAHERIQAMLTMPFSEFLKRARKIHGDKYQYDEATYHNSDTKMAITCPVHGVFMKCPGNHIGKQRQGCPRCAGKNNDKT
ncbi:MAG: DUF723 domain-containing protein [Spirochaetaceae bacterium]|jgi:hypothetical protein|nr:DUF723 domain-containing protein [Spirochaetaceae bacterium]